MPERPVGDLFQEAFEQHRSFRIWLTDEKNSAKCLCSHGEGYGITGSKTFWYHERLDDNDQLWTVSCTLPSGKFKLINVKHKLQLCAHRSFTSHPTVFCHPVRESQDQIWCCVAQDRDCGGQVLFHLVNLEAGLISNSKCYLELVGHLPDEAMRTPLTEMEPAAAATGRSAAIGAALGVGAVIATSAALLACEDDQTRRRRQQARARKSADEKAHDTLLGAAVLAAGAAIGAAKGVEVATSSSGGSGGSRGGGSAGENLPHYQEAAATPTTTTTTQQSPSSTSAELPRSQEAASAPAECPSPTNLQESAAAEAETEMMYVVSDIMEDLEQSRIPLEEQRTGLETVRKLLVNLVQHPDEQKYRQIKKSNRTVQQRLFGQCFALLRCAGFSETDDVLTYAPHNESWLHAVLISVESKLESLLDLQLSIDSGICKDDSKDNDKPSAPIHSVQDVCSSLRKVMVLERGSPAEVRHRESLRSVWSLLSSVAMCPERWMHRQVNASTMEIAGQSEQCRNLLRHSGFVDDDRGGLTYKHCDGSKAKLVMDAVLELLEQCAADGRDMHSSSEFCLQKTTVANSYDLLSPAAGEASHREPRQQLPVPKCSDAEDDLASSASSSSARGGFINVYDQAPTKVASFTTRPSGYPVRKPGATPSGQAEAASQPGEESCRSQSQETLLHVIRFSQSSIAATFRDGRPLDETEHDLRSGRLRVEDLPLIRVVEYMDLLWTLDNRRLSCFKGAFPERRFPEKKIVVKMEVLSDKKVRDEFLRKFTTGTTVAKREKPSVKKSKT